MAKKVKKNEIEQADTKSLRIYDYILISLFAVFIILVTSFKISGDDDIFWHLETGRYITENKVVPSADVFGFVTEGQEWIPFEWGWDVISYLIYSAAGYAGVSIFRTIIFLLIFFLFIRLIIKLKLNLWLSVFIFTILIFGMIDRLIPKPQIMSYLFFAILLYIVISFRTFNRGNMKLLYFLPVIFLVWCNMHMGVLAGQVIFTLFLISEVLIYIKPQKFSTGSQAPLSRNELFKIVLIYFASFFALLINPHGFSTYQYVYSHLNMKMLEDVFEWYSPFNKVFSGTIYRYIYLSFLGGSLVILYYSYKNRNIFFGLAAVIFAVFSVYSSRYTIDFMVITGLLLAAASGALIKESKNKTAIVLSVSKVPAIIISAILLFFAVTLPGNELYGYMNYTRSSGFGVDSYDYPVKMFDFIKENNIHNTGSRPFNSFNCGGYLIWNLKGKKNFIDSRNLSDDIYFDYKAINNKLPGFESKLNENNFDYIIWFYPGLVTNSSEIQTSVTSYLVNNPDKWKLIYWDDQSFLFVRNEDKFKDLIAKYEYKFVNPLYYIYQRDPLKKAITENKEEVFKEIQRKYKDEPEGNFVNSMVHSFKVPVNK